MTMRAIINQGMIDALGADFELGGGERWKPLRRASRHIIPAFEEYDSCLRVERCDSFLPEHFDSGGWE